MSSALEGGSSDEESDSEDDMAFINANQQEAASAEMHEQAMRDAEATAEEEAQLGACQKTPRALHQGPRETDCNQRGQVQPSPLQ